MPRYNAADVNIRLFTTDVDASTTPYPLNRNHADTKRNLDAVQDAFRHGRSMVETDVPCLGEESHVHFLGESPFLFIHARPRTSSPPRYRALAHSTNVQAAEPSHVKGARVTSQTASVTKPTLWLRTGSTASGSPLTSLASTPRSWSPDSGSRDTPPVRTSLGVEISSKNTIDVQTSASATSSHQSLHLSFGYNWRTLRRRSSGTAPQNLKVEIYVNGDLSICHFVTTRGVIVEKEMETIFSGRRFGRTIERAWLLALGSNDRAQCNPGDTAQRWYNLAKELSNEADACGRLASGERSPSGDYLAKLAKMEMPAYISDLPCMAEASMGFIDIIVSLGSGTKDETTEGYIHSPVRMRNTDCKSEHATNGSGKKRLHMDEGPLLMKELSVQNLTNPLPDDTPVQTPGPSIMEQDDLFTVPSENGSSTTRLTIAQDMAESWLDQSSPLCQRSKRRGLFQSSSPVKQVEAATLPDITRSPHPHSVPLTPFCDIGSPMSIATPYSSSDLGDDFAHTTSATTAATTPRTALHSIGRVVFSLGSSIPFLDHTLTEPASLMPLSPVLTFLNQKPSHLSMLSSQQCLGRSPTSPKRDGYFSASNPSLTAQIDLREVTQDLPKIGGQPPSHTVPSVSQESPKETTPTTDAEKGVPLIKSIPGKAKDSKFSWQKKVHSTLNNELQRLSSGPSPKPSSLGSRRSLSRKSEADLEKEPTGEAVTHHSMEVVQQFDPQVESESNEPSQDIDKFEPIPCDKPREEAREVLREQIAPKRKRFSDQYITDQTWLSLDDSRRSIRPRPRPPYEGMDTSKQAVAGAQETRNDIPPEDTNKAKAPAVPLTLNLPKSRLRPAVSSANRKSASSDRYASLHQSSVEHSESPVLYMGNKRRKPKLQPTLSKDISSTMSTGLSAPPSQAPSQRSSILKTYSSTQTMSRQSFPVPKLSKGSMVTYAEDGQQREDGRGEYGVRQVRAERSGVFVESEVLLGVRYVVTNESW